MTFPKVEYDLSYQTDIHLRPVCKDCMSTDFEFDSTQPPAETTHPPTKGIILSIKCRKCHSVCGVHVIL